MIIRETIDLLYERIGNKLNSVRVSDVRIGMFLTAVELSDGSAGAAATQCADHPFCRKTERDFGPLTPSKIKGTAVTDIMYSEKNSGLISSLRMAVMNALSSTLLTDASYRIHRNSDPLEFLYLNEKMTVTIVGAFQSYIRKISAAGSRLNVLEMNREALNEEQRKYFVPADDYATVIPESDIVIITGQTLVNDTIDNLLNSVADGTRVIVTGPSGSIIPDILFRNNVSIVGATRITDSRLMFDVVGEGGTGFHLFEYCAEKITLLR